MASSGKDTTYDGDAHKKLTEERAKLPEQVPVFVQKTMHPLMNPYGISPRECRESPLYPNATPVMFQMDTTGSMGKAPTYMAKTGLPEFMRYLYEGGLVSDPQPLITGIGDAENPGYRELSPIQVGQFEGEASKMDQYLMALHLEGQGGNNAGESYGEGFFVAAYLTSIDCHEKHGRKGYNFMFGDEPHLGRVTQKVVKERIGMEIAADIPMRDVVAAASEKYHNFFLIPNQERARRCERVWRDLLGDHVIVLETEADCAAACAALIGLTEGTIDSLDEVGGKLVSLGCDESKTRRVTRAVATYAASIGRAGKQRPVQSPA